MSANDPRVIKILDLLLFGTKKKKKKSDFQTIFKTKRKVRRREETSILVVTSSYSIVIYDAVGQDKIQSS